MNKEPEKLVRLLEKYKDHNRALIDFLASFITGAEDLLIAIVEDEDMDTLILSDDSDVSDTLPDEPQKSRLMPGSDKLSEEGGVLTNGTIKIPVKPGTSKEGLEKLIKYGDKVAKYIEDNELDVDKGDCENN